LATSLIVASIRGVPTTVRRARSIIVWAYCTQILLGGGKLVSLRYDLRRSAAKGRWQVKLAKIGKIF
jgi:hypothetical protein